MERLSVFDGKQTNWSGLWWHPETNSFSSAVVSLSELRKFKGTVRLYVRKNKFYNKGENDRPNYMFSLRDVKSDKYLTLGIETYATAPYQDEGVYYTGDGVRLYTREEVRSIINGTFWDAYNHSASDPYDILPEDFVQ